MGALFVYSPIGDLKCCHTIDVPVGSVVIGKCDHEEIGCEGMDWIHLAQNRALWRALVNRIITFGFNKRMRISWTAERLLSAKGGLISVE
jgi:hypothetical protein